MTKIIEGFENYTIDENCVVRNMKTGRVRKIWIGSITGYRMIGLSKKGKQTKLSLHRIFATAYIPNPENLPCIDHIDNDRMNNRIENLRWCTHKQNIQHASRQGRMCNSNGEHKGSGHPNAILSNGQVLAIKNILKYGYFTQKEISVLFGVHQNTVSVIKTGRNWSHLQTN